MAYMGAIGLGPTVIRNVISFEFQDLLIEVCLVIGNTSWVERNTH